MATNQFLPFGTSGGAPVLSNSAYAAISPANGFGAGILPKERLNKALRQGNAMAAAIGAFIAGAGLDALDDGNIAGLTAAFIAALQATFPATQPPAGVGQTWSNMSGSRSTDTDYVNNTGRVIQLHVVLNLNGGAGVIIDGVTVLSYPAVNAPLVAAHLVPAGSTYRVHSPAGIGVWAELR